MVLGARPFYLTVASLVLAATAGAECDRLGEYIADKRPDALQSVLDNIGPNGAQVPGAAAGLVVASPSKHDPDC